ncbi:MAG: hypothetical protein AAF684_00745 [Pseudomonadota bacterium]
MTRVLAEIRRAPGVSRSQLARSTSFTEASLSRITKDLIGADMILEREESERSAGRGRPTIGLHVNPRGFTMLAVVDTIYEQTFSLVSLDGHRMFTGPLPPRHGESPADARVSVDAMKAQLRRGLDAPPGAALGLSAIYLVTAMDAGEDAAIFEAGLADGFGAPVQRDGVAQALHRAELQRGENERCARSLLAHAGVSLGASLILDRAPADAIALENAIGAAPVGTATPPATRAWRRIADASSGLAVLHQLRHETPQLGDDASAGLHLGLPHAVRQANAGDPRAVAAFAEAGRTLGVALATTAALIQPQRIFLAGPLAQARPYFEGFAAPLLAALPDNEPDRVLRSRISYLQASEASGIERFVFADGSPLTAVF